MNSGEKTFTDGYIKGWEARMKFEKMVLEDENEVEDIVEKLYGTETDEYKTIVAKIRKRDDNDAPTG